MIIAVDMESRIPQALGGVTRVVPQLYQAPLRRPVFGDDVLAFTERSWREPGMNPDRLCTLTRTRLRPLAVCWLPTKFVDPRYS